MKICPQCNTVNDDHASRCVNCGAVLDKPILALICPHCGKVSALGTSECPVCHTKLPQQTPKMVKQAIKAPNKKRTILGILLSILIFGSLFLMFSSHYSQLVPNLHSKYVGLIFDYQDRHHKILFTEYYIAKQQKKGKQLQIAYLGRGRVGKSRLNVANNFAHQFRSSPHYQLTVEKHQTVLNGPHRVIMKIPQNQILHWKRNPHGYEFLDANVFPVDCKVVGNPKVKSINLNTMLNFREPY